MIRTIRKIGDPVLRKKAKRVEKITPDIHRLIDDMIQTMRAANGLGLAAPQVGVSLRLAVVDQGAADEGESETANALTLINPEVIWRSEELVERAEGCLSIPGWYGDVARPARIVVKATGRDRAVEITVDVTATRDTDLVMKADEVAGLTRHIVQSELGLRLAGKPQVFIKAKDGAPRRELPKSEPPAALPATTTREAEQGDAS